MSDATSGAGARVGRIGGAAAFGAVGILVFGIAGLATRSAAIRPWLAVLLGIDSGTGGVSMGTLRGITAVDVLLLIFAAATFAGFWPGSGRGRQAWTGIAILLPVAGIAVLVATGLMGRSGLMGGLLVLSILLLSDRRNTSLSYIGLASSVLLLIGDFSTTGTRSWFVSGLVAAGYALLTAWFVLAGARLLGSRRHAQIEGEILIERPVGEVFDFVADERNEPRYNPAMTSVEQLTEGEIGPGTRFEAIVTSAGRPVPMVIELTTFERPARLASRSTMSGMEILGELIFEAVGDATRMRWAWNLRPSGALRLVTPLMVLMGRRQENAIWASLKRCLEGSRPEGQGVRGGSVVDAG